MVIICNHTSFCVFWGSTCVGGGGGWSTVWGVSGGGW